MAWSFSYFFDSFKDPFPWVMTKEEIATKNLLISKMSKATAIKGIEASNLWNPDYLY